MWYCCYPFHCWWQWAWVCLVFCFYFFKPEISVNSLPSRQQEDPQDPSSPASITTSVAKTQKQSSPPSPRTKLFVFKTRNKYWKNKTTLLNDLLLLCSYVCIWIHVEYPSQFARTSVMNNYDTTFTQNQFPGTLFSWCAITLDGLLIKIFKIS